MNAARVKIQAARPHMWIIGLVALLFTLWSWALASPVGASPDEDFHLSSIWCGANSQSTLCEESDVPGKKLVSRALLDAPCFAFDPNQSAGCQNLDPLSNSMELTDRGNFQNNYPPVYYWLMSTFATDNIAQSVITIRFLNSALLVAILGITFGFSAARLRIPFLLAYTLTVIPLGAFLMSSVNPSSWAIALVPASWIALYGSLTQVRRREKVVLGVIYLMTAIMVAGARGDAAIFVALGSALAMALAWDRQNFVRRNRLILSAIAAAALVAFAFFISTAQLNVIFNGLPGVTGHVADSARGGLAGAAQLFVYNLAHLPSLWMGSFGTWGLGWLDTPMPDAVTFASLFAAGAFIVIAFGFANRRTLLALGLNLVFLSVIPLAILQISAARIGQQVQPRYILPLVVLGFVIAATVPVQWDRRARLPMVFSLILLVPANAVAITWNILRYRNGLSGGLTSTVDTWWWGAWSPLWVIALSAVSFALLVGSLVITITPKTGQATRAVDSKVSSTSI